MRNYAGAPRACHGPFGLPPLWSKPVPLRLSLPQCPSSFRTLLCHCEKGFLETRRGNPLDHHTGTAHPLNYPSSRPLLLLLETDTEADDVAAGARVAVAAVGRTQVRACTVPRPAPKHTAGARSRSGGLYHWVAGGISCNIPVCRPFPDISVHIEKAPGVGRVLTHITSLFEIDTRIIGTIPVIIGPR